MRYIMGSSFYATFIDPFLRDIRLFVPGFAGMKPGDKVLDVCCGTGDQALHYAAKGIDASGIDLDEVMIAQAEKGKSRRRLEALFAVQDASELSFADNSFDFTTVSMALHEKDAALEDAVISEMRRVTKIGGVLVLADFSVPLPGNFTGLLMRSVEFIVGGEHYRNFKDFQKSGGLDVLAQRNCLAVLKKDTLKGGALTVLMVTA